MIKGLALMLCVLVVLVGLLFWAKTRPAPGHTQLLFGPNTSAGGIHMSQKPPAA